MAITVQQAARSQDFIQSIGINGHLTSTSSSYGNIAGVISQLQFLGVNHIRGQVPDTAHLSMFQAVGAAGNKLDLIVEGNLAKSMASIDALAPYVATVEGPNEVNRTPVSYNGLTGAAAVVGLQADLYKAVHSDTALNGNGHTTSVLAFTVSPGTTYAPYGDITAYADYNNVHAYGQAGCPSYWYVGPDIARAVDAPTLKSVITETGSYTMLDSNGGVSQVVQAKLMMNTLLDAFKSGVKSTYIYQLEDGLADPTNTNSELHYGLFNVDGTAKVSATALHNLTSILADTGAASQSFNTGSLAYSVTGLYSNGNQYLMEKSNGAYDIALWQEPYIWNKATNSEVLFAPRTITVSLGAVYNTINVYDPMAGTAPVQTYHNVSSVQVALGTSAMVVEVEPNYAGQYISTGPAGGVFASKGHDTVAAGSGAATVNAAGAATITGSTGSLAVNLAGTGSSVTGGAGALTLTDAIGGNTITGGAGVNSIILGSGADTVTARGVTTIVDNRANVTVIGQGNVSINGGMGSLTLTGSLGDEYVFTQAGTHNLLNLSSGKNSVLGHGADTINASTASGASSTYVYAAGPDLITGGAGTLSVNGQGSAITVQGGTGAVKASTFGNGSYLKGGSLGGNVLSAAGGNTTLVGGGSGDTLTDTGSGNNLLVASAGTTTLTAGSGNDTLVGGAGADMFVFTHASTAHAEVVQNFKVGTDHVSFAGFGATTPIASQQVVGGNLQLTLADQTQVTFLSVTSLS